MPDEEWPTIKHNRAQCLSCGDVVESKSQHDCVACSCGKLAVDGGHRWIKRSWSGPFKELSEREENDPGGASNA